MQKPETIEYKTFGTCSKLIRMTISDNKIESSEIIGGCNGNLKGIQKLIKGMDIDEVIGKFSGICCGDKPTSCPDQIARCLTAYKTSKQDVKI